MFRIMAAMSKRSVHSNKCDWQAPPQQLLQAALPDYTNGHEKGYQNVRVGQGKPLTSGNTARLLL